MRSERTIYMLFVALLVVVFGACEKEIYSSGTVTEGFPMYVTASGNVVSTGQLVEVDYAANAEGNFFDNVGAIGTASAGERGNTLVLGLFQTLAATRGQNDPVFTLQFWPSDLPEGRAPELAELEEIFVPGRVFPFGRGGDSVRMNIAQAPGTPLSELSSSAYTVMQEGTLTVTEVFTYESGIPGLEDEDRTYRLARFSFSGTIGVFNLSDFEDAEAAGEVYRAKESVVLSGEASLVLEATWR